MNSTFRGRLIVKPRGSRAPDDEARVRVGDVVGEVAVLTRTEMDAHVVVATYEVEAESLWEACEKVQMMSAALDDDYEVVTPRPCRVGPKQRFLTVRYDVTGLTDGEIDKLSGEAQAQAEKSDPWDDEDEGHPDVPVTTELTPREVR